MASTTPASAARSHQDLAAPRSAGCHNDASRNPRLYIAIECPRVAAFVSHTRAPGRSGGSDWVNATPSSAMASTSPLAAARCNRGRAEERSGGGTDGRCGSDTRPRCHGIESGGRPSSRLVWQHAETTRTHPFGHPANCAATSIRVRRLGHHRLQGSPGSRIRALPQGIWMAAARVTDVGGFGHTSCATPPSITSPRRTAGMNSSPTSNGAAPCPHE
jgi:hypothetical protein